MAKATYLKTRDASLPSGGNDPVAAFTIPVLNGLTLAYLFSGGTSKAHRNYAPGAMDGSVVGEPTSPGRYVRFSGVDSYVNTGVAETLAVTCFVIARVPLNETAAFIGSPGDASNAGFAMYSTGPGNVTMNSETTAGRVMTVMSVTPIDWQFLCGITPATGGREQLRNLKTGAVVTNANTANRANTVIDGLCIGTASPGSSTWKTVDILAVVYFNRVLSDPEIDAMTAWGRAYAADFGVTV